MKPKISCVLMAAGNAKRFGENKLAAKLNGKSIVDRVLNCIPSEDLFKVIVVSQYQGVLNNASKLGFIAVKNSHPEYGISHTIEIGMDKCEDSDAIMFMVSDQPLLNKQSVKKLIKNYQKNTDCIVAMSHNGIRGNPCIFPAEYFGELKKLTEDNGGSSIIRQHEDKLLLVEVSEIELSDIDTKEDLKKLISTI